MISFHKAWLKSVTMVLIGPMVGWFLLAALSIPWGYKSGLPAVATAFEIALIAGVIGAVVHLLSYAAIGLPIFYVCYSISDSPVWRSRGLAMIMGTILGFLVYTFLQVLAMGGHVEYSSASGYLIGPAYGFWTGIWARRYGPSAPGTGGDVS